jgi:hypothetical protein
MGASAAGAGALEPLRKALGPFASVVFNKQGHLQCPEPIIRARAALAGTEPVQALRPQALPIKALAVGLFTAFLNLPCGAWREHTRKFSLEWVLAVHATIPFIACIRKAVVMPKYAILLTVGAAVVGQAIGARLERARIIAEAEYESQQLQQAQLQVQVQQPEPAAQSPAQQHGRRAALALASMSSGAGCRLAAGAAGARAGAGRLLPLRRSAAKGVAASSSTAVAVAAAPATGRCGRARATSGGRTLLLLPAAERAGASAPCVRAC